VSAAQGAGSRRRLRRFCWWDRALWWYSYTVGGFEGYRTAGARRLACATMETAINRPDMAEEIRRIAARRR
jgi:hypothetical protein